VVISFFADPTVHTRTGSAFALAPHADTIQPPGVLGGLPYQVDDDPVEDEGAHASHESVGKVTSGSDEKVRV